MEPLDQQVRDAPELRVNVAVRVEGHPSHPDGLVEQSWRSSREPHRNDRTIFETLAKLIRLELGPDSLRIVRPQKRNDVRRFGPVNRTEVLLDVLGQDSRPPDIAPD